ncbi:MULTISPECIES: hypothetical protein [unclassified Sphingomonas]|nr:MULTISPECIES: hypothetical protein [unclassified Sphingomonas]KQX19372.1 hypothetical protein ASD17_12585 [Sphingomonas sp. Root1294]KQY65575.1 hypothetical protein ASD39_15785 [Sphingomonas sp. Root50]KRB95124.1 hypothetical protein ASE22_04270 [Sphingomonas sp. Root720]
MSAADKRAIDAAVASFVETYPGDVPMVDLRCYVREKTGLDISGPVLAHPLKRLGYRRDGERKIDTCPGKTVFYTRRP